METTMRTLSTFSLAFGLSAASACGGGGGGGEEDLLADIGFATPTEVTTAYAEVESGWELVGTANWSCLNTLTDEVPTSTDITLSGTVADFQTDDPLPDASVTVYGDDGITGSEIVTTDSDAEGLYELQLPSGGTTWAFKVVAEGALDTYTLNEYFAPTQELQSSILDSVSVLTAQALPAFIGVTRTPGLGVIAGSIRDCDGNRVKGAVAAVSDTVDDTNHVEGGVSYYFSALATSLPVRHSQQSMTNDDGVFVTIELPPGQERYLQIWGFTDEDDLADGEMTLLGQTSSPIIADAVVKVIMRPQRQ